MNQLTGKKHTTPNGDIFYRTNTFRPERKTLVFLHGAAVDGRSFMPQVKAFADVFNLVVWDMPAHGKSRPFPLTYTLPAIATWLHEILEKECVLKPILIGHSMGGYIAQCFIQQYPGEAGGFVSIDSASLQRRYMTKAYLWGLDHTESMYRAFPWKLLLFLSARGNAESKIGQHIMQRMMADYSKDEFCRLAGQDFRQVAAAYRADLPYIIDCPCLLICGKRDRTGLVKQHNEKWEIESGLSMQWIENAGHSANIDASNEVNALIRSFVMG